MIKVNLGGKMNQIDIFEVLQEQEESEDVEFDEILPFEINQKVQVKEPFEDTSDPEDYYYLMDFKKKRGYVSAIHRGKILSYTVVFDKDIKGIFYHNDLIAI